MDPIFTVLLYLFGVAFAVIGLIDYIKAVVGAIKIRTVSLAMILSPVLSVGVAFIGAPIIWGTEIVGTISYIYFASGLGVLTLATVQLAYTKVVGIFDALADWIKSKIGGTKASASDGGK